jgi:hypothetical protein
MDCLVVDELVVLKHETLRGRLYRAKGVVDQIKHPKNRIWIRLRPVAGATMKTVIIKPWFERRYKHRHDAPHLQDSFNSWQRLLSRSPALPARGFERPFLP